MGYNQHSLCRQTATAGDQQGWGRESMGQQPGQGKHGQQHRWLRSRWQSLVSISRPEPLVFGFRLFAVSGLSLLTEPRLVNNPWRGTLFSSPRHCLGPSLEQNPTCCLSSQEGKQPMQQHLTPIPNHCHSHTGLLIQCPGLSLTSASFCPSSDMFPSPLGHFRQWE